MTSDLASARDQNVMLLYMQEPMKVSYDLAKFAVIGTVVVEI